MRQLTYAFALILMMRWLCWLIEFHTQLRQISIIQYFQWKYSLIFSWHYIYFYIDVSIEKLITSSKSNGFWCFVIIFTDWKYWWTSIQWGRKCPTFFGLGKTFYFFGFLHVKVIDKIERVTLTNIFWVKIGKSFSKSRSCRHTNMETTDAKAILVGSTFQYRMLSSPFYSLVTSQSWWS